MQKYHSIQILVMDTMIPIRAKGEPRCKDVVVASSLALRITTQII